MPYLFLDANIYLHYQDFETINWSEVASTSESITIVLPPVTLDEIDKIKDQGKGKVSNRARAISQKLGDILLEGKSSKYPVIHCDKPSAENCAAYGFDASVPDDEFIASLLLFNNDNDKECVIVARDNNLLLKAKQKGLRYIRISDNLRLPQELSPEEKELNKLRKEFDEYRNALPKPALTFDNGKTILRITRPQIIDIEKRVQEAMDTERVEHPYLSYYNNHSTNSQSPAEIKIPIWRRPYVPTNEEVDSYNSDLDEYFKEFEERVRDEITKEVHESYIKQIEFRLCNDGTAPTGKLIVSIDFPSDLRLYDSTCKKSIADKAIKPLMPTPFSKALGSRESQKLLAQLPTNSGHFHLLYGYIPPSKDTRWDFSKCVTKRKYQSTFEPLTHGMQYIKVLEPLFIDTAKAQNFGIEYQIIDAKLPRPIDGVLNVVIE